jgi:protein-S-isoprenylcysteine O-methyltransferase Ste14
MTESLTKFGDGAGVRFPPPFIYAVFCGAGLILDEFWSLLPIEWSFASTVGWGLTAVAFLLMTICVVYMRRARTTIRPDKPTVAIVSSGPFAYSRNPIYVGWLILYFGVALV